MCFSKKPANTIKKWTEDAETKQKIRYSSFIIKVNNETKPLN